MKIGIIGCGIITQDAHIPALMRLKKDIDVIAICNHSEGKAHIVRDLLGNKEIPVYTNWEIMIKEQRDLDAVLIALPIPLNYPVSKACLDAGIAVLCEKPAGANIIEAERTIEFISPDKPLYMIAENFQFLPYISKVKEILESEKVGKLHSIQMNNFFFMEVDSKFNKTQWRCNNEYPGGYLLDGGVHNIHVLEQIAGPVENVMGRTLSINPKLGTHDLGFALLKHTNGVVTSYNMALQNSNTNDKLKLFCTYGALIVDNEEIKIISSKGEEQIIKVDNEDTFYLEWQDFYNAYTGISKASVKQEDVIRDVRVVESILLSSKEGKEVII